jgi:hypothetical protein
MGRQKAGGRAQREIESSLSLELNRRQEVGLDGGQEHWLGFL